MGYTEIFPAKIKEMEYAIERKAKRAGLDFFPVIFEMVRFDQMNELAATGGFPVRWHHWIFGQEYERLRKFYKFRLSKIYEMVINTDPCFAYLLDVNDLVDHKTVMAHAFAHCDFFKNNIWFASTNRKMLDDLANHGSRIERYKSEEGEEEIEKFVDACFSIKDLIDIHASVIIPALRKKEGEASSQEPKKIRVPNDRRYLDRFFNPIEWLEKERERLKKKEELEKEIEKGLKVPAEPTRDILLFLMEYAPLERWQKNIMDILLEENYYFSPIGQTKIMNEGWASYWHSKIMTEMGVLESDEVVDYAEHCAGTWHRSRRSINPYKLGLELWADIEWRWDTGRHGPIYEHCKEEIITRNWDEFIVFKELHQRYPGIVDNPILKDRWNEFRAFVQNFSQGKFGFPKDAWSKKKMVQWWMDYLNLENILKRLSERRDTFKKEIKEVEGGLTQSDGFKRGGGENKKYMDEVSYSALHSHSSEIDILEIKKSYSLRKRLLESDLNDVNIEIRFYHCFNRLKSAFKRGKVEYEEKEIPKAFSSYADQHKREEVKLGQGLQKIFEVRKNYNDINFISTFFTDEFCIREKYYTYESGGGGVDQEHYGIESTDPEKVRRKLLFELTNLGHPIIYLENANYNYRKELYLKHLYEGMDLKFDYLKQVLEVLFQMWQHPIWLETIVTKEEKKDPYWWIMRRMQFDPYDLPVEEEEKPFDGWKTLFHYDGRNHTEEKMERVKVKKPF